MSNERLYAQVSLDDDATAIIDVSVDSDLSGAVELGGFVPVAIQTPPAWTSAAISFDGSSDHGVTYFPVNDEFGEYKIEAATIPTAEARHIALNHLVFLGLTHLKVRSGLAGAVVAQAADRTLRIVTRAI